MTTTDSMRHRGMRQKLVDELRTKGISDERVLSAVNEVPRHLFFEPEFEKFAYVDKAFPINSGQTISQPYTVAYQSQLLRANPGDEILEIGTGSGYQAAILYAMGYTVFSVEIISDLHAKAKKMFTLLNMDIKAILSDGTLGWKEHAPYAGILVTAGAPSLPKPYINQLKIGGRLVIPVGKEQTEQRMVLVTKTGSETFETKILEQFKFVPLLGELGWK